MGGRRACALKGVQRGAHAETEEWLGGPYTVLRGVRQLVRSLKDLADRGAPQLPGVAKALPNGQVAAPVFPADPLDRILLRGITAEVWLDPEVTLDGVPESMAGGQRPASRRARVALVLGAGNVTSIGPMDVLHKLFSEGECVVLKLNPVNEAVGPALTEALRPLIDAGRPAHHVRRRRGRRPALSARWDRLHPRHGLALDPRPSGLGGGHRGPPTASAPGRHGIHDP